MHFLCAQRVAGVLLNISAKFWRLSSPDRRAVDDRAGAARAAAAAEAAGIDMFKNKVSLYVVGNGRADDFHRTTVPGKALAIARTSIEDLFKISNRGAQYRVYVLTHRNGIDFNLAQIPQEYNLDFSPVNFNQIKMQELFDLGLNLSKSGYPWLKTPQFLDPDEIIEISNDIKK